MGNPLLSARQTAVIIGCSEQKVREHLKHGVWRFGEVVPKEKTKKAKNAYLVNRRKLLEYLQLTDEEAEQRLSAANL